MKTIAKAALITILVIAGFLAASLAPLLLLHHLANQPYCPDRVIETTSPEVSC